MRTYVDLKTAEEIVELAVMGAGLQEISKQKDVSPTYVRSLLGGEIPLYAELVKGKDFSLPKEADPLEGKDFTEALKAIKEGALTLKSLANELDVSERKLKQHIRKHYPALSGQVPQELVDLLMRGERTIISVAEELGLSRNEVRKCLPVEFNPPRRNILQVPDEQLRLVLARKKTLKQVAQELNIGYLTAMNRFKVYLQNLDPDSFNEAVTEELNSVKEHVLVLLQALNTSPPSVPVIQNEMQTLAELCKKEEPKEEETE